MRNRISAPIFLLLASLILIAGCEPKGPIPGGELSGTVVTHSGSWSQLNATEVVQLEVNGGYSVNIWGVGLDRGYYVASAKGDKSKWARKLSVNPAVKLRIEDNIYELVAVPVHDEDESKSVLLAYKDKYELEETEDFPDSTLYRLDPR